MRNNQRVSRFPVPILLTLLTLFVFRMVLFIGYVPSASMEPTLQAGSFIIGSRFIGDPGKGDIIVFYHDGKLLVKRIAACPGEIVDRSELSYMTSVPIPAWDDPELVIPEGCYFVLGDNSQDSFDSRYWDDPFVRTCDIVACVFVNGELDFLTLKENIL